MSMLSFFTYRCSRCGKPLTAQVVSIVTEETICMACDEKESLLLHGMRGEGEAAESANALHAVSPAAVVDTMFLRDSVAMGGGAGY
ncbi:MAG TPA: hypothetical protein VL359_02070 [bacterium]|nr:hypothetical protein [bacterium]